MQTIIIGISGASASGKTLLAETIVNELANAKVHIISEDSYYKSNTNKTMEERDNINYDHPNSMDHALLHHHLVELKKGNPVEVPTYDYAIHDRSSQTTTVHGNTIIIIEGILLFVDPIIRTLLDVKLFMETPSDLCLSRRLKRDTMERNRTLSSVLDQYEKTVKPMYLQFIEPTKRYADVIVPNGGYNRIAINLIKSSIRELLGEHK